ncbi:MAG: hypothetical protein K1X66_03520 [Verrucomicrobiae bacterium]|nr:hypothetical protein [Verrucomicrobiae bacterium]
MISLEKKRVSLALFSLILGFFLEANYLYAEPDSDQDGLPDAWELEYGLDPTDSLDAKGDDDQDSLTALQEYQLKTNPTLYDTQGFGMSDSLLLGLQGYYPLNETESIVAFDQTPYQRHGYVYEGGAWNPQIGVGGALELNNTLGYLQIDGGLINQQTNVTISFLFRTQYPGKQILVNAGNEQSSYELVGFFWESDYLWFISDINGFTDWQTESLADNQWHRFAFVRDAQGQSLSVWVDDHLVGQANRSLGPLNIAPNGFIFGRGAWGWTTYGEFDEVRIYNRVLKPEELQELYNKSDMDKDGLADYWELENFGNTMTKNGNEGDADLDGMSDTWELEYGLNPADPSDANSDDDQDSLTALQEFKLQTNPTLYDTYGYGMSDSLFLGLQGYYPLNEAEGMVAYDQSSYQRNGFLQEGGVWKPAAGVGGALSLDNTYGYLQLNGDLVDGQNNVTISFLLKTQYSGKQMLFNAINEQSTYELVGYLWQSNYLWWISGVVGFTDWPITSLADNQWHRLTFIRDGSEQKLKIWVDDQFIGDADRSITPLNVSSNGFLLGRGAWGWPTFAEFDEVRIYDRALKTTEVQELYSKSDMDQDGLPDVWELKYFGNSVDQSGWDDADGDGKSNQEEQQQGTDPNDYYEGFSPTLTITQGNNQKSSPNQFLPQALTVKVTKEGQSMINAPITFTVLSGGGKLSLNNDGNTPLLEAIETKSDGQGLARIYYKQALNYNTASTIQAQANQSAMEFQATTSTYEESDSDNDGMLDPWENTYGLNPFDDTDCLQDLDGDRIPNVYEFANNTLPNDKDSFPVPHHIVDPVNGANSPNDNIYKTIAEAISKASAQTNVYSVIFVKAATYQESINPLWKRVLLLGELGQGSLPAISSKSNNEAFEAFNEKDNHWALDGFVITHQPGFKSSGINVSMGKNNMASISHCIIQGNSDVGKAGGIHLDAGRLWVNHCLIVENKTSNAASGKGIYVGLKGHLYLQNSIVWNEDEENKKQIYLTNKGEINVSHSFVMNGEHGAWGENPGLIPNSFRLKASSAARNAGANLALSRWDVDGEWRNDPVDVGVDEFVDTDNDGMPDAWEMKQGFDKNNPEDANGDGDADGLTNVGEYEAGTSLQLADTDGDGLKDGEEVNVYQSDPKKIDSDGDGMPDGWEVSYGFDPATSSADVDHDGDGLSDYEEYLLQQTYGETLDPTNPDSNGDGVIDGVSIQLNINPVDLDVDKDGLINAVEIDEIGTNPFLPDTDGDGVNDKDDAFPLDPNQSQLPPGDPQDEEAPIITLKKPENAVLIF